MELTKAARPFVPVIDAVLEAAVVPSFTRAGPAVRSTLFRWAQPPPDVLRGSVAVVTGATSGIGAALAHGLVDLGASVHVVGRDQRKLSATVQRLADRAPGGAVVGHLADLGRLEDVRNLAEALSTDLRRIDVLANVAGAMAAQRTITDDGNELTFQVHVVAPFLLTARLLPQLSAAPGARVLTMSSGGMYTQGLDVDDLITPPEPFDGTRTYARAKRAQVALNAAWAERQAGRGIGFHALHPGWVDTAGLRASMPGFARLLGPLLRSPRQGADTALWLAWSREVTSPGGDFWLDRRRRHTIALPWTRTPPGEVDHLWREVSAAAGLLSERAI